MSPPVRPEQTGDYAGVFDTVKSPIKPSMDNYAGVFDAPKTPSETPNYQGFLDYTGALLTRGYKLARVVNGVSQEDIARDPELGAIIAAMRDPKQAEKIKDFGALFGDMIHDVKHQVVNAVRQLKEQGMDLGDIPLFTGQFLKGIEKPIGDLMELSSGVQLTQDDIRALTPEEKRSRLKNVVATSVMLGVAKGVHAGIGAVSALGATEGLVGAAEGTIGPLAKRLLANAATGVAAGASYGLVEGAGDDDQLSKIIANGIMGGTLGTGLSLLGEGYSKVKNRGQNRIIIDNKAADEIAQVRSVQSSSNTIADDLKIASAFQSADDIAQALIQGKIKPDGITRIPGIDPFKLGPLSEDVPSNFRTAIHMRNDGLADLLVHDVSLGIDERFFERHGFVRDQTVSLHGDTNWNVSDVNGDNVILENKHDATDRWVAKREDVRHPSDVESTIKTLSSDVDTSTKLYDAWKSDLTAKAIEKGVNFMNAPLTSGFSLQEHLRDFLDSKQLEPKQTRALNRDFQMRLVKEATSNFEPEDAAIVNAAHEQHVNESKQGNPCG